jgi:hypothetical protein
MLTTPATTRGTQMAISKKSNPVSTPERKPIIWYLLFYLVCNHLTLIFTIFTPK